MCQFSIFCGVGLHHHWLALLWLFKCHPIGCQHYKNPLHLQCLQPSSLQHVWPPLYHMPLIHLQQLTPLNHAIHKQPRLAQHYPALAHTQPVAKQCALPTYFTQLIQMVCPSDPIHLGQQQSSYSYHYSWTHQIHHFGSQQLVATLYDLRLLGLVYP